MGGECLVLYAKTFPSHPPTHPSLNSFSYALPQHRKQLTQRKTMITLEANYSKKLGLPGYSSHQFSITLRTEIQDLSQVQAESARLYRVLQDSVDESIQDIGYLPSHNGSSGNGNGNGHSNGHTSNGSSNTGNGHTTNGNDHNDVWKCSPKQKELILKIVEENRLDKTEIEQLARDRFNTPVKTLNKLQASGIIKELIEKYPGKDNGNGRSNNRPFQKAGGR